MSLFSNTEQISLSWGRYITDLRKLYEFHSLRVGSPTDFLQLAPKLASSEGFRLDLSDIARTIRDKEQGRLSAADMLTIAAIAVGGEEIASAESELSDSAGTLLILLAGVGGWREASDVPAPIASAPGLEPVTHPPESGSAATSSVPPLEMRETLARLELASMQFKTYLDEIDRRMGRMEPQIEGINALVHASADRLVGTRPIPEQSPVEARLEPRHANETPAVKRRHSGHSEGSMAAAMDLASGQHTPLATHLAESPVGKAQALAPGNLAPVPQKQAPVPEKQAPLPEKQPVRQPPVTRSAIKAPEQSAVVPAKGRDVTPDLKSNGSSSAQAVLWRREHSVSPRQDSDQANALQNRAATPGIAASSIHLGDKPSDMVRRTPVTHAIQTPHSALPGRRAIPETALSAEPHKADRHWWKPATIAALLLATSATAYHYLPRRPSNDTTIAEKHEEPVTPDPKPDEQSPQMTIAAQDYPASRGLTRGAGLSLAAHRRDMPTVDNLQHPATPPTGPQTTPDRTLDAASPTGQSGQSSSSPSSPLTPPAAATAPARQDETPQAHPQVARVEGARSEFTPPPPRIENLSPELPTGSGSAAVPKPHVEGPTMVATSSPSAAAAPPTAASPALDIPRPTASRPLPAAPSDSGKLLSAPPPVYPQQARLLGLEGKVVVEATVDTKGKVRSTRSITGPYLLQQSAQDAIRQRRYAPLLRNGQPVEFQTLVTVDYRLNK